MKLLMKSLSPEISPFGIETMIVNHAKQVAAELLAQNEENLVLTTNLTIS